MPKTPENGLITQNDQENFEEGACRERILTSLKKSGFKEEISQELIARLILLEQGSESNKDSREIEIAENNVLNYLKDRYPSGRPEFDLKPDQMSDARVAALLHDIGKSGPPEANEEQQKAVVSVFALERVNGVERPIRDVVTESFPEQKKAAGILKNLSDCGIDPKKPMRYFYDQHAYWTHDILKKYPREINNRVLTIASSHHINGGIDPSNKQEKPVPPDIIKIQGDEANNLSGKVLMVVDKYQARRRRMGESHDQAIDWARKDLLKYEKDEMLQVILSAVDELGKQDKIFT